MDPAEDDCFGVRLGQCCVGELERVAYEVCVLDDFVSLVEVAQDDGAVPQRRFGGPNTNVKFGVGGFLVLFRKLALARRGFGRNVVT
ncbi:hypothetical protein D3C73_1451830 [compost metagenome]